MSTEIKTIHYSIALKYTRTPGTRKSGEYSGEHFRETVLRQLISKAIQEKAKLIIDLAGTHGYAPSFLEESFGGLIREGYFNKEVVLQILEVTCDEMPLYAEKVVEFIRSATKK